MFDCDSNRKYFTKLFTMWDKQVSPSFPTVLQIVISYVFAVLNSCFCFLQHFIIGHLVICLDLGSLPLPWPSTLQRWTPKNGASRCQTFRTIFQLRIRFCYFVWVNTFNFQDFLVSINDGLDHFIVTDC